MGNQATTASAPPVLDAAGKTVGTSDVIGIVFDQPLLHISMNVAATTPVFGPPGYILTGYDNYQSGQVQTRIPNAIPADQWHQLSYSPNQSVQYLEVAGRQGADQSLSKLLYFDNLQFTFIPEPAIGFLLVLGLGLLLLRKHGE
jgi:hypothetical protein